MAIEWSLVGTSPRTGARVVPRPQGGRDELDRAGDGRDRDRQRDAGARDPRLVAARSGSVRERELCSDPARTDRVGAVRTRARCVHGRGPAPPGPLRARRGRDALPRRGRRAAGGDAGRAVARSAGARVRTSRRHGAGPRGRAHRRGHQSRSRGRGRARNVPARPVLSPRRLPARAAAAARARGAISRCWSSTSSHSTPAGSGSRSARSTRARSSSSMRTRGPATCASCRT